VRGEFRSGNFPYLVWLLLRNVLVILNEGNSKRKLFYEPIDEFLAEFAEPTNGNETNRRFHLLLLSLVCAFGPDFVHFKDGLNICLRRKKG
jgi:hypothetical protein